MKEKTVGRKYSRRVEYQGGLQPLSADAHHIFDRETTQRFKTWALSYLDARGIAATAIVSHAASDGWINEGAALRSHVQAIEPIEDDDVAMLAARIFEVCRNLEELQANPETSRPLGLQWAFQLGRLTMLAKAYGIDDEATQKRVSAMVGSTSVYSLDDIEKWRSLYELHFVGKSFRQSAQHIARRMNLPTEAVETIRKDLAKRFKKSG